MRNAPCKDCDRRHPNCHAECASYIAYSKERQEMLKARSLEYEWSIAHENQAIKALLRKKKRERRR